MSSHKDSTGAGMKAGETPRPVNRTVAMYGGALGVMGLGYWWYTHRNLQDSKDLYKTRDLNPRSAIERTLDEKTVTGLKSEKLPTLNVSSSTSGPTRSETMSERASRVGTDLKDLAAPITDPTKTGVETAKRAAVDLKETIKDTTDRIMSKPLDESLSGAKEYVKDKAYEAKENLKDSMSRDSKDYAKDKAYEMKEGARDAKDKAYDTMRDSKEYVKDKARDSKEYVKDKARDAKDTLRRSDSVDYMKDKAHDAKEYVKDKAQDTKEFVKDKARDTKDTLRRSDSVDYMKDKAHDAKESLKEKAYEAKEFVKEKAYDAKESAKDLMREAKYDAKEKSIEAKQELKANANKYANMPSDVLDRTLEREQKNFHTEGDMPQSLGDRSTTVPPSHQSAALKHRMDAERDRAVMRDSSRGLGERAKAAGEFVVDKAAEMYHEPLGTKKKSGSM